MRLAGGSKHFVLLLMIAFVLLASSVHPAFAASGAFDPSSVPRLLPDGASLGTVDDVTGQTKRFHGSGPCTTESMPHGYPHAAVYRTTASTRSLLELSVTDDQGGSRSLCRVAVYEGESGGVVLEDPFDSDQRQALLVEQTSSCSSSSHCGLETWLSEGKTYYIVLWADPQSASTSDASFAFDASVRRPSSMALRVSGYRIKENCSGTYEIITGRNFTVTASSSQIASGAIRFILERPASGGTWSTIASYTRTLASGSAALALRSSPAGSWRITALVAGSDERLDAIEHALLRYVSPRWKRFAGGGVLLTVPWYHQRYRLSCEAAALRMAHNFHDPSSIDHDLQALRKIGVDNRPRRGGRWGNPNKAFVGNYNGVMMKTGYGVHYAPVALAATKYDTCRPAVKLVRPSRQTIAAHLSNGYPVIVWGAHRGPSGIKRVQWRAWDGQLISAVSVEHTWVVIGFHGSVANPTSFVIHNPSGRARQTVSLSQFTAFTRYFRTGVVVRG